MVNSMYRCRLLGNSIHNVPMIDHYHRYVKLNSNDFRHLDRKRRRTIESKTETKIKVPRHSQSDDGHIEICGSTRSAVESAMKEIEKLAAQKQRRLTHFLSIPINNKGIVEKFSQFKVGEEFTR